MVSLGNIDTSLSLSLALAQKITDNLHVLRRPSF